MTPGVWVRVIGWRPLEKLRTRCSRLEEEGSPSTRLSDDCMQRQGTWSLSVCVQPQAQIVLS